MREKHGHRGHYVSAKGSGRHSDRWVIIVTLLIWDGLLLYMIVHCLIVPVYGAGFVAMVSVYLGYQL